MGDGKASQMIKVTTLPGAVAMNLRATLALSVVVLSVICFAQEPKNAEQPGRVRSEIQTRAEALFDRARLLSDIRAEKSAISSAGNIFAYPQESPNLPRHLHPDLDLRFAIPT